MIEPITSDDMRDSYARAILDNPVMFGKLAAVVAMFERLNDLPAGALYTPIRKRSVVWPRQDCWAWLTLHGYSLSAIGRHWGMDHTSVLYGVRAAQRRAAERVRGGQK